MALGIWNVDGMMREMPSRLMTEWMAYHNLEPFGDELLDIHLAELRAVVTNANREKGSSPVKGKKLRLWKDIETFDPQDYFDRLKTAFTFSKND